MSDCKNNDTFAKPGDLFEVSRSKKKKKKRAFSDIEDQEDIGKEISNDINSEWSVKKKKKKRKLLAFNQDVASDDEKKKCSPDTDVIPKKKKKKKKNIAEQFHDVYNTNREIEHETGTEISLDVPVKKEKKKKEIVPEVLHDVNNYHSEIEYKKETEESLHVSVKKKKKNKEIVAEHFNDVNNYYDEINHRESSDVLVKKKKKKKEKVLDDCHDANSYRGKTENIQETGEFSDERKKKKKKSKKKKQLDDHDANYHHKEIEDNETEEVPDVPVEERKNNYDVIDYDVGIRDNKETKDEDVELCEVTMKRKKRKKKNKDVNDYDKEIEGSMERGESSDVQNIKKREKKKEKKKKDVHFVNEIADNQEAEESSYIPVKKKKNRKVDMNYPVNVQNNDKEMEEIVPVSAQENSNYKDKDIEPDQTDGDENEEGISLDNHNNSHSCLLTTNNDHDFTDDNYNEKRENKAAKSKRVKLKSKESHFQKFKNDLDSEVSLGFDENDYEEFLDFTDDECDWSGDNFSYKGNDFESENDYNNLNKTEVNFSKNNVEDIFSNFNSDILKFDQAHMPSKNKDRKVSLPLRTTQVKSNELPKMLYEFPPGEGLGGEEIEEIPPGYDYWENIKQVLPVKEFNEEDMINEVDNKVGEMCDYFERLSSGNLSEEECNPKEPDNFFDIYYPNPQHIQFLKNLNIELDWKLSTVHQFCLHFIYPQKYGPAMDAHGVYSKRNEKLSSDDQENILQRWIDFQKEYLFYDLRPLLSLRTCRLMRSEGSVVFETYRYITVRNQIRFGIYLCKDLPEVTPIQALRTLGQMVPHIKSNVCIGSPHIFTTEDVAKLEYIVAKYGRNFKMISAIMGRFDEGYYRRRFFQYIYFKNIKLRYGPWTDEEVNRLRLGITNQLGLKSMDELGSYKSVRWQKLMPYVRTRTYVNIRMRVHRLMFKDNVKNAAGVTSKDRVKLIEWLHSKDYNTLQEVDWSEATAELGNNDVEANTVKFVMLSMYNAVPSFSAKNYDGIVDYLHQVVRPKFQKIAEFAEESIAQLKAASADSDTETSDESSIGGMENISPDEVDNEFIDSDDLNDTYEEDDHSIAGDDMNGDNFDDTSNESFGDDMNEDNFDDISKELLDGDGVAEKDRDSESSQSYNGDHRDEHELSDSDVD